MMETGKCTGKMLSKGFLPIQSKKISNGCVCDGHFYSVGSVIMNIPMYFYIKTSPSQYYPQECYRLRVIHKKWLICPDMFEDIPNPTGDELKTHDTFFGALPPPELLKN